jgi:hypothetical protein
VFDLVMLNLCCCVIVELIFGWLLLWLLAIFTNWSSWYFLFRYSTIRVALVLRRGYGADAVTVTSRPSNIQKISVTTDCLCQIALNRILWCKFEKLCKFSSRVKTKSRKTKSRKTRITCMDSLCFACRFSCFLSFLYIAYLCQLLRDASYTLFVSF